VRERIVWPGYWSTTGRTDWPWGEARSEVLLVGRAKVLPTENVNKVNRANL